MVPPPVSLNAAAPICNARNACRTTTSNCSSQAASSKAWSGLRRAMPTMSTIPETLPYRSRASRKIRSTSRVFVMAVSATRAVPPTSAATVAARGVGVDAEQLGARWGEGMGRGLPPDALTRAKHHEAAVLEGREANGIRVTGPASEALMATCCMTFRRDYEDPQPVKRAHHAWCVFVSSLRRDRTDRTSGHGFVVRTRSWRIQCRDQTQTIAPPRPARSASSLPSPVR